MNDAKVSDGKWNPAYTPLIVVYFIILAICAILFFTLGKDKETGKYTIKKWPGILLLVAASPILLTVGGTMLLMLR